MSHEKIVAAAPVPATINFYYRNDDVFDLDSLLSMYQASGKEGGNEIDLIDKYSFTEDERDVHLILLNDGAEEVFQRLLKYTKAIPAAIKYSSHYAPLKTVAELNAFTSWINEYVYKMEDAGTLTLGTVSVVADDLVYFDGTDWVKDNDSTQLCSFVKIVDQTGYNENYTSAVDVNILKCLKFYVLKEWFSMKGLDNDAAKHEVLYAKASIQLVRKSFQLKKVVLS